MSASYVHARFGDYFTTNPLRPLLPPLGGAGGANTVNNRGNTLPNAPEFSTHASVEYSLPLHDGRLSFRGEVDYISKYYFLPSNDEIATQSGAAKFDASVRYQCSGSWTLTAFVKNITDKTTIGSENFSNRPGAVLTGTLAPPRTFGVEAEFRF